jgi:hypothetical protein
MRRSFRVSNTPMPQDQGLSAWRDPCFLRDDSIGVYILCTYVLSAVSYL